MKTIDDKFDELHNDIQDKKEALAPFIDITTTALGVLAKLTAGMASDAEGLRVVAGDMPDEGDAQAKLFGVRAITYQAKRIEAARKKLEEAHGAFLQALYELDRKATPEEEKWIMGEDQEQKPD